MTSKPCKILKKDGAPYRGSGFDQLDGYCIANTPAPSCPPPPVCRHAPKTIFTQSLVNSRLSLVHLSVTLTFQRIGQRGDSYRLSAARIRLPFARFSCMKPAICAGAVNHPHHTNCVNHSSNKCQPAPVRALIPAQPIHPPHAARTRPAPRRVRPSPATRLPSCAQNSYAQSLVNSRLSLVHLSVPLTFQRIGQRGDFRRLPTARIRLPFARCPCTKPAICAVAVNHPHHTNCVNHSSDKCQRSLIHALIPVNPSIRRARPSPASRLPSCAQNFFTQSLVNSRLSLVHLSVPLTFQSIGQRGDSYRLPAPRIRLPIARCPCTKTAICAGAAAVNHPHHSNHVNHSSNKCQRVLLNALIPVNPSIRRQKASSPTRTRPPRPRARPSPSHLAAVMRQKFLAQSHTISRKLSSNAPASLRTVDTSKNWTKRRLLQVACGKNPTAIRPVLVHEARDLRWRR